MSPKFRVPRATFLAAMRARQAVQQDAPTEARDVKLLIGGMDTLVDMVKERSQHIGLVNDLISKMIEEAEIDELPGNTQDALTNLLSAGVVLAVENSGFSAGGHW